MNLAGNPYAQYKKQSITTATPEKLLIMLFDGALRFTAQARRAMEEKNISKTNEALTRVQDIVNELMASLNMDYEISHNLYSLYEYINYTLIQANIKKDMNLLTEAEQNLRELRETWVAASKIIKTGGENGDPE